MKKTLHMTNYLYYTKRSIDEERKFTMASGVCSGASPYVPRRKRRTSDIFSVDIILRESTI